MSGTPPRVLIVEDSPTQAAKLAIILEEEGFATVVARDGEQGLELFKSEPFDLVVSDIVMPGIDGYELCRRLKADARGRDVPVVLLSTLNDPRDIIQGLDSGADNFITKPFEAGDLVRRLRWILANREARAGTSDSEEGIEIFVSGKRVTITSAKEQILDLLIASVEDLVRAKENEQAARAEAEAANQMKDRFLAMVSHELRTPLNAMTGWIRLIKMGKLDGAGFERALDTIERNAKAQAQIVDDLLDLARMASDQLRLDVQTLDLAEVLEQSVDAVRPLAEAKRIDLRTAVSGGCSVSGDPYRFQQVVWNLLTNAIKFTPEGGRIEVDLARRGPVAELAVKDTGDGIDPEFLPYVFDRFRQAEQGRAGRLGGLGLGLAISRHIVERHGGTIDVTSDGQGHGATFTVRVPVRG
jgi:signal transduction histidine kinase